MINTPSPVHFIVDHVEERRTTNTGYLVKMATRATWTLGSPSCVPHGALLLFPGGRKRLTPADAGRPLIVVDGTWRKAKAITRKPPLLGLPLVTVDTTEPSRYRLRTRGQTEQLCTLEAIARALSDLGDASAREALESLLEVFVHRMEELREGRTPTHP